jgi:hypothetical protein
MGIPIKTKGLESSQFLCHGPPFNFKVNIRELGKNIGGLHRKSYRKYGL